MTKRLIQHISIIGIGLYLLALIVINLAFRAYAMRIEWMLWGIGEVLFFFVLTAVFYPRWKSDEPKAFWRKVFWVALAVRVVYVVFVSYYFYFKLGYPFEGEGDAYGYFTRSVHLARYLRKGDFYYVYNHMVAYSLGFSDQGYQIWLRRTLRMKSCGVQPSTAIPLISPAFLHF